MADKYFIYVSICIVIVSFVEGTSSIKGLYCQDPDTGKLYPVNSTWPSESFCGNYTCKLRHKNVTETEYKPITKITITKQNLIQQENPKDMSTSPSEQSLVFIKKDEPLSQPVFHKEIINKVKEIKNELNNVNTEIGDRYLTEAEIKTITEILQTVKKSDLEAIIEIYNIAQDIFKEMDSATTKKLKENTKSINLDELKANSKESISYWYEPLHHDNLKERKPDMKIEETHSIPTSNPYIHPTTYFNGPLTDKDFRKLPYYYPISSFQRMASYLHNRPHYDIPVPTQHRPCNKEAKNYVPPTWYNAPIKKPVRPVTESLNKVPPIQPMLLPYPFSYVHHYNYSAYPASFYYNNYPWAQLDVYKKYKNYPQPYYNPYPTWSIPNTAMLVKTEDLEENPQELVDEQEVESDIIKTEDVKLEDWQTEPLSAKVLEEVKANILESSKLLKPLSLRKNVKLEKVGKVIKLDELSRTKRAIDKNNFPNYDTIENKQYEVYLERTTCDILNTEPGYFRVGNTTAPYPACCPQRINS